MKDWKAIATAHGLDLTPPELERLAAALAGLEEKFRPLLAELSSETEPATLFHAAETDA